MDSALRCNILKCRKLLDTNGIVTTCSHIFCVDCSNAEFGGTKRVCPACETLLSETDDIALTNLNPSDDYKTVVCS